MIHSSYRRHVLERKTRLSLTVVSVLFGAIVVTPTTMAEDNALMTVRPLRRVANLADGVGVRADFDKTEFDRLRGTPNRRSVVLPLSDYENATLEMEPFSVTNSTTQFLIQRPDGTTDVVQPDVLLLRGQVAGEAGSRAFLALTAQGSANGYITRASGERFYVGQPANLAGRAGASVHISPASRTTDLPDFPQFCGVEFAGEPGPSTSSSSSAGGPVLGARVAMAAIEGDQEFVALFPDETAAMNYVVQLFGAVSDIYLRDFNVRLVLDRVRLWPAGGAPFDASNLGGFRSYYIANEDVTGLNLVHLISGRRGLSYGGIAYVGGTCSANATYGISAYLLGGFPTPVAQPDLGNWDVIVTAHEMGHNMGTFHTHDGYAPTIDDCGNGVASRGTIMSYCHTHAGGTTNIDVRFHGRVQQVVESDVSIGNCLFFDCNDNGIDDALDIATLASADANANGVPDECEDCNSNGTLDDQDIVNGAADVNGNGVPDVCETDCDGDSIPDETEISLTPSLDMNGNNILDACEPDCDGSGQPDFAEIAANILDDFDRNTVPDVCQDCDANGQSDWLDVTREFNVFVAERAGYVREYHRSSGYPITNWGEAELTEPYDAIFGPDNELYVADYAANQILNINVDTVTSSIFVPSGLGGLAQPAALAFDAAGDLLVGSDGTSSVIKYDGASGALIGTFVASGSGGLSGVRGMTFGPDGHLYISDSTNSVRKYDGGSGASLGVFVAPAGGGLNGARGLVFIPDGRLLVAGQNNHAILGYDGGSGAYTGVFNDAANPAGPWGLRIGPNGNVFVGTTSGAIYVVEYDLQGRYQRRYVRGDPFLVTPGGFDFRPASVNDCNVNHLPDWCDAGYEIYGDVDHNGTVSLFDLFCILNAFDDDFSECTFEDVDVEPCGGNGTINLLDLFAVLNALAGEFGCCTVE